MHITEMRHLGAQVTPLIDRCRVLTMKLFMILIPLLLGLTTGVGGAEPHAIAAAATL